MAAVTNIFTDNISMSYTGNGKAVTSKIGTYTGTKDAGVATVVSAGAVNQEIDIVFVHATIQSAVVDTDQNLTVLVNSATTPTETFVITKTASMFWGTDFQTTNPFGHDVTKFFVSNAGTTDARFNVRVLYN